MSQRYPLKRTSTIYKKRAKQVEKSLRMGNLREVEEICRMDLMERYFKPLNNGVSG